MFSFKTFIEEATISMGSDNGSSLVKYFSDADTDKILDAVRKNAKRTLIDKWISSVSTDNKYSETLFVDTGKLRFTLYASYGVMRIGGGGNSTSRPEDLKKVDTKMLVKELPSAKIVK